jgi:hypothetical protein
MDPNNMSWTWPRAVQHTGHHSSNAKPKNAYFGGCVTMMQHAKLFNIRIVQKDQENSRRFQQGWHNAQ